MNVRVLCPKPTLAVTTIILNIIGPVCVHFAKSIIVSIHEFSTIINNIHVRTVPRPLKLYTI